MLNIYLASPLKFGAVNQSIANYLTQNLGVNIFLPASLETEEFEERFFLAEKLYTEINKSDIIVIVIPFGLSVAAEIGYAIALKHFGYKKSIIAFRSGLGAVKYEDNIDPYIEAYADSMEDLAKMIKIIGDTKLKN
jgi:nucleoside 2-deoxyribosyltransferase